VRAKFTLENVDEFSLAATSYAGAAENNFFKWPGPLIASEQTMKFHTTRRSEILRILQGMLNVLYFGQKPDLRVSFVACLAVCGRLYVDIN